MKKKEIVKKIVRIMRQEKSFENLLFEVGLVINYFDNKFVPDIKNNEKIKQYLRHNEKLATKRDVVKMNLIIKGLEEGKKIQNIINYTYVKGRKIVLSKQALSPGPEADTVIDSCFAILKNKKNPLVIDLCTGCGVLGLLIAYEIPSSLVYGIDIDKDALKIAEINRRRLQLNNVELLTGDLLGNLNIGNRKIDLIVANPPFCKSGLIKNLPKWLKFHSPRIAINGGKDGLIFYRKIISYSKNFLKSDGKLVLQHDINQRRNIKEMLVKNDYKDIKSVQNIFGKNTISICGVR